MKATKKANLNITAMLIIILIAAAFLFAFQAKLFTFISSASGKSICSISTALSSATKFGSAGTTSTKIECPMQEFNLTKKEVYLKKDQAKAYVDNFNEKYPDSAFSYDKGHPDEFLTEFNMNKEIAKQLTNGWRNLGRGRDLFPNPLDKPKVYCILYAKINFDDELQRDYKNEILSLKEWMKKNKVPNTNGLSYYAYLLNDASDSVLYTPDLTYNLNEPLAVVYGRLNFRIAEKPIREFLSSETGTNLVFATLFFKRLPVVLAATAGLNYVNPGFTILDKDNVPEGKSFMFLSPYSEVGEMCDVLVN